MEARGNLLARTPKEKRMPRRIKAVLRKEKKQVPMGRNEKGKRMDTLVGRGGERLKERNMGRIQEVGLRRFLHTEGKKGLIMRRRDRETGRGC